MSGIEVVIVVGGVIYVTKKVKERKERKRLERSGAGELEGGHGTPQLAQPQTIRTRDHRLRQQVPVEDEALPLYKAPTQPLPNTGASGDWSTSIHLPTYDEVSKVGTNKETEDRSLLRTGSNEESSGFSSSSSTPPASPTNTHLAPPPTNGLPSDQTTEKKRRFWRRQSSSKPMAEVYSTS